MLDKLPPFLRPANLKTPLQKVLAVLTLLCAVLALGGIFGGQLVAQSKIKDLPECEGTPSKSCVVLKPGQLRGGTGAHTGGLQFRASDGQKVTFRGKVTRTEYQKLTYGNRSQLGYFYEGKLAGVRNGDTIIWDDQVDAGRPWWSYVGAGVGIVGGLAGVVALSVLSRRRP